ncbi:MAG: orotidine-5'-phosphate decarboxylase [Spirochaetes bacterium]|nr:MAG: orotidine-5'-phosphate decarboxylase [Spirochaetota bacterium]
MNYIDKLKYSAQKTNSIICMGIDPIPEYLPYLHQDTGRNITAFFEILFQEMIQKNILPGAFKPNLGFFSCLDRPRESIFSGSAALSEILDMLDSLFPGIPVILDYKRGDIARSSANYALEGFESWGCDSVTVSPWMGSDSVKPFLKEAALHNGGVYLLNRTSNPGSREFQNVIDEDSGKPMFRIAAEYISRWAEQYPGTGAVTGATSLIELKEIADFYSEAAIPLLIPGVGSQGGSAQEVMGTLKKSAYNTDIVRINVSSAITHPWAKKGEKAPEDWKDVCVNSLRYFNEAAV